MANGDLCDFDGWIVHSRRDRQRHGSKGIGIMLLWQYPCVVTVLPLCVYSFSPRPHVASWWGWHCPLLNLGSERPRFWHWPPSLITAPRCVRLYRQVFLQIETRSPTCPRCSRPGAAAPEWLVCGHWTRTCNLLVPVLERVKSGHRCTRTHIRPPGGRGGFRVGGCFPYRLAPRLPGLEIEDN